MLKHNLMVLLTIAFMVSGCSHHVKYKLSEKDRWQGSSVRGVVYVKPFTDHSTAITNRQVQTGDVTWRTNYRDGYAKTNLTDEVTAMVVNHLRHSGLFTKVISGSETGSDFVLSGSLTKFDTYAEINHKAETIQAVSAGFGLIGALVGSASTAKMTSEIKTDVQIDNLKLSDQTGQALWEDSLVVTNKQNADFRLAGEVIVFLQCDEALKQAVSELISRIGNSTLTNWPSLPNR